MLRLDECVPGHNLTRVPNGTAWELDDRCAGRWCESFEAVFCQRPVGRRRASLLHSLPLAAALRRSILFVGDSLSLQHFKTLVKEFLSSHPLEQMART